MSQTFILKADNYSNKMFPLEHNSCVNTSKDFASSKSLNLSTKKEQKNEWILLCCIQSGVNLKDIKIKICHEYYKSINVMSCHESRLKVFKTSLACSVGTEDVPIKTE